MTQTKWTYRILTLSTLLIALWLRVHQLEQYPAGLHFDEAANAILSSEIAFEAYRPIFISSYTGKETFFFYIAGGIMNRLGTSIFSLRLTAAFLGLLTIATTYRLCIAVVHDRRVAMIAIILLTTTFSHLLFSRLGFRAISQPLTQGLTLLFLVQGLQHLETGRSARLLFAAAGLFLGLTAHTYLAARLFPIALAIPLLLFLVFRFIQQRNSTDHSFSTSMLITHFGITGLVAAFVLAPLLYWFALNPEAFWVRIGQVGDTESGISTIEGLQRAGSMLFWDGDPYIRFNIPHRPLFFPLMIIPSAIGVWKLIANSKNASDGARLGRLVILIAPLIMLLPTALATSEIVPSNLRAIGIFPFIILWPAVGLVWLVDRLLKAIFKSAETPVSLKYAFIPLFITLLGTSTNNVYRDYFNTWGNRSDGFYETEGDIKEVASYLNKLDSDRPITVSTRFVPHPALAFLAQDYDKLILIPESRAVVYPAGEVPLYILPASSGENALTRLFQGDRAQILAQNQLVAFDTLIPNHPFPQAQTAAFGNFGFAVSLIGYDLERGKVGETLTLRAYYDVLGSPGFNMIPFVHLEDHLGNRWSQLEQPGYSPADWKSGDQFVQQFELPLPAGLPPTNNYTLRIGWFDEATGQEVTRFDKDGQFAGSAFLIDPIEVLANRSAGEPRPPDQKLNVQVADGLTLNGFEFNRQQFNQGDLLDFALWWQADQPQVDIKLVTQLVQNEKIVQLESADPAGNSYPFTEWQTPSSLIDRHQIQIPADLEPGEWQLQIIAQFPDQSKQVLFDPITLIIEPLDLILEEPNYEVVIDETFENQIKLVGYTFKANSGEFELIWQASGKVSGDYVAFVQHLDSDQSCCIWQSDRPITSSAARPTSRWLMGEYMIDRYQVENYQKGNQLIVGLYRPENGIRLLTSQQTDFVELK